MNPTIIDIPQGIRSDAVDKLNYLLALMADLYSQFKTAHWNVKGMNFISLHKMFDDLAGEVDGHVDSIAERLVALGGIAYGTIKMAASSSTLSELSIEQFNGASYLKSLAINIVKITSLLREYSGALDSSGDITTANFLLELAYSLDKMLYFIESHLSNA
ncbi:DNA starvation/stationary phase protection protein Dps [Calothrix sp. FACHB-1219]|uniref:DNA starvation/stationary phase protection protein Dps n=1 Tax=unclassified Calothrix TaxID=2619626 RepID=UPI001683AFA2|nr:MULTISPECIES: DNA starvation/stationary phase protection protein Dps [unclassified Calothrix]MBD2201559.1 DNA starvation/stationary phase protection protein Dps [Calothrix sp. FACHB-168]MBD2217245.1 DNA starvation/stationary phase protection protein Dps [Calothrix sp. FACHB-1219]